MPQRPSMSSTKATAGGFAGALVVLTMYVLNLVPFVRDMPADPKGALVFIVSAGIGYLLVYYAPPNKAYEQEPEESDYPLVFKPEK